MAFGGGVLISAVSFDLIEDAAGMSSGNGWVIAGIFAGARSSSAETG
jgi:ZIP family zinc transporter